MSTVEIEFYDEGLPSIQRTGRTGGIWGERLAPLREKPGVWAKVYETTAPHAMVANLSSGKTQGFDPEQYEFAGRVVGTKEVEVAVKDDDGNETGETEVVEKDDGLVFARFLGETEAEREALLAAESDEDE